MTETDGGSAAREQYERKTAALVGQRILSATYWDIHNFAEEPRTWDYGDWHHAVMGVEFVTDTGTSSILWTNTFFPYGVEVFPEPISRHLLLRPQGPEGWPVGDHPFWQSRVGSPIRGTATFWEVIEVGPGHRLGDGARISEPQTYSVPVALRLDFDNGPVWMVAGIPQWPDVEKVFVAGDEVMLVFPADRMLQIGFPNTGFLTSYRAG